jgi:two-component system, cell cycle sensor histidine kinase and response regulator CckA
VKVLPPALIENSNEAVLMVNEDGTIRFATQASARLLGYTPEERVGHSGFELVHPDDVERTRAGFAEVLRQPGVPIDTEYRVRHKNGEYRDIAVVAVNRLDDKEIGAVVINYHDVTERRRAEQALRQSESRLRHIVEHAQDLIYYCDPAGRFTYVNPAAARVMKYEEGELLGLHFMTLIRPDYRDAAAELYTRQIVEHIPNTYFEFPSVTKDGDVVWVGQHVQLVYEGETIVAVHAIARDITRQKHAEERLRKSEARYRSLIVGAAYGIYRSTFQGEILDANPALVKMLGYGSVQDLLSHNMREFYRTPADRVELIRRFAGEKFGEADVAWKRKDGTPILVHLTARMVDVEVGVGGFEGIAEDITERRALEEQLRQAQKMEAVGRLARGVAHDFNNVLAAIIGSSDLIMSKLREDDPAREEAEEIRKAAERGASLTRQLLAFSRRQVMQQEVVDLNLAAGQLNGMLQRMAGDLIVLNTTTAGKPVLVRMEAGQLEQVLMNLVVNARDAMPEGGRVDITVESVSLDERSVLRYQGLPAGDYARISVCDTGTGITPEQQAHVFEPFFTPKSPAKGTGLGLSIIYGIAKENGGAVTFTTAPNEGTTFEVLLPLILEH